MIHEHDSVVLLENLATSGLEAGDVGVVIHVHRDGAAFEVEFLTLEGKTVAIETLESRQVRPVHSREIPHVRQMLAA